MTSIDELSGRELDAAIHEALFGAEVFDNRLIVEECQCIHRGQPHPENGVFGHWSDCLGNLPLWSDDEASAWPAVLDAMEARGWGWLLGYGEDGHYDIEFWYPLKDSSGQQGYGFALANTRGVAVCRGALRALSNLKESND